MHEEIQTKHTSPTVSQTVGVYSQVLDGKSHSCGHSHSSGLRENISVDVHHQVSSRSVLHHKTDVLLRLETCKQVHEERVAHAVDGFENPLLTHQTGEERRRMCGSKVIRDICACPIKECKLQTFTCPPRHEPRCLLSSEP